jgi:tetratricopeptide (TPR) repeat protein
MRLLGDRAANVDLAITHYRRALKGRIRELSPRDWALAQSNLAAAYRQRTRGDQGANLGRAIAAALLALTVYDRHTFPADWARTQNELAMAYRAHVADDGTDQIDLAIEHYKLALSVHARATFPADWAMLQNNLAIAYSRRREGDASSNHKAALRHFEDALSVFGPNSFPLECMQTARNLGNLHFDSEDWPGAADAYLLASQAADTLYGATLLRGSREAELQEAGDLHRRVAYALSRVGLLQDAVVAVERGRAQNLRRVIERERSQIDDLRDQNPALYSHYVAIVERLRSLEVVELQKMEPVSKDRPLVDSLEEAYGELEEVLRRIQSTPGLQDVMAQPSFSDVSATASHVPIVYVVVTAVGGVGLIAWPDGDVSALWLDDLTESTLREQLYGPDGRNGGHAGAYRAWRDHPDSVEARQRWRDMLEQTLAWLNRELLGPLAQAIQGKGFTEAVLIPTGLLGLLPMHAATIEAPVTFALAPNAQCLTQGRPAQHREGQLQALLVADPNPTGELALPLSPVEVPSLVNASDVTLHTLAGYEATDDSILRSLPKHNLWHLATHGIVDWGNPLDDALYLAGEKKLRLRDVLSLRARARLAVLSACETGIPNADLPDEAISLSTGMIQAGAEAVIGSLGRRVLRYVAAISAFYKGMFGMAGRSSKVPRGRALREAQKCYRPKQESGVSVALRSVDCPDIDITANSIDWALAALICEVSVLRASLLLGGMFAMGKAFDRS